MSRLEQITLCLLTGFFLGFISPPMRKLLLVFLAACSASPVTENGPSSLEFRAPAASAAQLQQAFSALPKPMTAMAVLATPSGPQVFHTGGISITVSGHLASAQTADGGWIIQVNDAGATLLGYSSSNGTTGAVLNWPGWKATTFDGPFVHRDLQVPAGTRLVPEDALVVASGATSVGGRGTYPYPPGRSACDEMAAFVFVRWAPSSDVLRPPAIGAGPIARFFRSAPVPTSALDVDSLPRKVDLTGSDLTPDYLTALNRPFSGEMYAGWFTDNSTPDLANPGYGREWASVTSLSSMGLVSTWAPEQKRPLAIAVAQRGFDLVGAYGDGRQAICGGGHSQGRKACIVWLGHLLHIDLIANPTAILGPVFGEVKSIGEIPLSSILAGPGSTRTVQPAPEPMAREPEPPPPRPAPIEPRVEPILTPGSAWAKRRARQATTGGTSEVPDAQVRP